MQIMTLRFIAVTGFLALAGLTMGTAMARGEEFVCSPMQGQLVTADGVPVAGVDVRREWYWRGKSGETVARTDEEGRFAMAAVHPKRGLFGLLPAEETASQYYFAQLPEGEFEFLNVTHHGLQENGETKGRPFRVQCRMGVKPGKDDVEWGTCTLID